MFSLRLVLRLCQLSHSNYFEEEEEKLAQFWVNITFFHDLEHFSGGMLFIQIINPKALDQLFESPPVVKLTRLFKATDGKCMELKMKFWNIALFLRKWPLSRNSSIQVLKYSLKCREHLFSFTRMHNMIGYLFDK